MRLVAQSFYKDYGEAVEKYINTLIYLDTISIKELKNIEAEIKERKKSPKFAVNVFSKEN